MKKKKSGLILKKLSASVLAFAVFAGTSHIDVSAINELENELIEGLRNRVKSEATTSMLEKSEKESSDELADEEAYQIRLRQGSEVTSGDAAAGEDEPVEIVYKSISIESLEDFLEFSKNCKSDAWSLDKTVSLKTDIDLTGSDFEMIPFFNGIFNGEGHEIKGYSNAEDPYITGVFRYIGINGIVQNLNVSGEVRMKDELKFTGGICGMNLGIIKNCTYNGILEGNNTVGAIAAINENTGLISGCTNDAHVSGYYYTGGITGKNYGIVSESVNNGSINDNAEWVVKDDEKGESIIQSISSDSSDETKIRSGIDTGGIAGYSKGNIARCKNKGNIGYEHVGYNVGGIVGRQMGIVSYCENMGIIYGRKDIGGIVGQMEPYLEPEDIQTLPEAADKLHDLVNKTLTDMDGDVDVISSDVTDLTGYANGVVDDGRALTGELTTSVNANVRVVNAVIERFEYVMQNIPGVLDHMSSASDKMYYFNNALARAIENINVEGELSDEDRDAIESSERDIYDKMANTNEKTQRMESLSEAINRLMYETDANGNYVYDENGNRKLRKLTAEEQAQLNAYLAELQQLASETGSNVSGMFGGASTILETYKPYASSATDAVIGETENAIHALQDAEGELREATNCTRSIIDYLNSQEKLRLSGLGSDWDASLDSLHANLRGISGSIENINQDGKSTSHTLNANLAAVNDQVNEIYHILSDRLDIIYNDDASVFTDVSDEDIQQARTGRVDSSKNKGTVKGDIDIGGIAGSMAIDEEDPEENAAGNLNIGRGSKYTLKNIIFECTNDATVESKKDGAGLIVGYMAQGIVSNCEGIGYARSTEGSYTGGIAGQSMSIIRDCDSLCLLEGNKYVGGITGYGTTITGCNAMATWHEEPSERFGSIAGIVNSDSETRKAKLDNISGNYFVENKVGGIDDINFEAIAQPVEYKKFLEKDGIGDAFRHLKVIFEVEGIRIGEQELAYGESLANLEFPEEELREGYYVKWPDVSNLVMEGTYILTGEYVATNKAIESEGKDDESGKPIAILGGSYGDDAYIDAQVVDEPSYNTEMPLTERGAVVYRINVHEGSYIQSADRKIRLYSPYKNPIVKIYKDGKWKDTSSKKIGSYVEVDMDGEEAVYAIVDTNTLIKKILKLAIIIVLIVLAAFIFNLIMKRIVGRKGKEKKEKEEKKPEVNKLLKEEADNVGTAASKNKRRKSRKGRNRRR
ncbi:hypothetical protein [Butyrivibrio sp. INlla16]|uniref:hypothetical protein n=1 Tax=Butyrivibrio sp. INlla16 TaxID=1520807 RepID=UPI00087EC646|nr:hypothetical protein [Butyrivibrio sp. INlla16]SDB37397.1 hypothetical protein SAMN02910263_01799 [Butyrivibrio sp. INlla16]